MFGIINEELKNPEAADSFSPVWGKIYRSCLVKGKIFFFDINKIGNYEDGLFNLEVFKNAKKAIYVNQYLYHYRKTNSQSLISKYNSKLSKQWEYLFEHLATIIARENLETQYTEALDNRISLSILILGINEMRNPNGSKARLKNIQNIIGSEKYRKACKNLKLKYFPFHWKLFYGCAKYNSSVGVYVLLLCIRKMIGR